LKNTSIPLDPNTALRKSPVRRPILLVTALLVASVCLVHQARGDDWPQWRGPNRDGIWTGEGLIETFPSKTLNPRWTAPVGPGYSGPTVADGRVFVMDRRTEPPGERVICLDAESGKENWVFAYDCSYKRLSYPLGPRASVTVSQDLAFALGAMGHFFCLHAATGEVRWKKNLDEIYNIQRIVWGVSPSPLVWKEKVIVHFGGADGACVVAFDTKTGEERWRAIDDRPSYSSPIIIEQAGKEVLLCWTEKSFHALDPETGEHYWTEPYALRERGARMNVATPVMEGEYLFACSQYEGASMYKVFETELEAAHLWSRGGPGDKTGGINPPICTALFKEGHVYGPNMDGEFCCLDAETGDILWKSSEVTPPGRWSTVHLVQNRERTWILNEAGELIIALLSPDGYREISRAKLIEPTHKIARRKVCWAHPAFADGCVFARNDAELVCVDLKEKTEKSLPK